MSERERDRELGKLRNEGMQRELGERIRCRWWCPRVKVSLWACSCSAEGVSKQKGER